MTRQTRRSYLWSLIGSFFKVDANGVFIDQLTTQKRSHSNQQSCQRTQIQPPRPDNDVGPALESHQPVERRQRQQHNRKHSVGPCGNQPPDLWYQHQIDEAGTTRNSPTQRTNACQPQAGTSPEGITRDQESHIRRHQTEQGGHREMDEGRVQRVAGYRRPTYDRFERNRSRHKYTSLLLGFMGDIETRLKQVSSSLAALRPSIIFLMLPACSGPLSMLEPAGPGAREAALLWWGIFAFFTLVYVAVVAAWLIGLNRRSRSHNQTLQSMTVDTSASRRWQQTAIIGGGVVLPTVAMFALLIPGIPAGNRMAGTHVADDAALRIEVTGHQWWWQVHYPFLASDSDASSRNEIHIPVDTPVRLSLHSADVIHSLWVPRLGPKVDLIPGRVNELFLQADEPGVYAGVCAEFCGLAHAHMTLEVHVHSAEDFTAWMQAQRNSSTEADP